MKLVRFTLAAIGIIIGGFAHYILILVLLYVALPDGASATNNQWIDPRDSDSVIVFVHGIFSDTEGCWTNRERMTSFPLLVKEDDDFGAPAIFVAGYHTTVKAGKYGVADAAREVWSALDNAKDPHRVTSKRNIVFVCHSTGGIVIRYLLLERKKELADKNIGLVLIASPSGGSELANILGPLANFYNAQLARELRKNNALLNDLDDRFREFVYRRELRLAGVEAFEQEPLLFRFFAKIVPKESATRYFGRPEPLPAQDHMSSVKPHDRTHPAYDLLLRFYTRDFKSLVETSARTKPPFDGAERQLETDTGDVAVATISPDGNAMAYVRRIGKTSELALAAVGVNNSETLLTKPDPDDYRYYRGVTFDADGEWIYFVRSRRNPRVHDLHRISRNGAIEDLVLEDVDSMIAFNPANASQFVYCHGNPVAGRSEVIVAHLQDDGTRAVAEERPRAVRTFPEFFRAAIWSPSGQNLLAIIGERSTDKMRMEIIDAKGNRRRIADSGGDAWRSIDSAVWLPTGEILFAAVSAKGGPQRIWLVRSSGGRATAVTRDLASYRSIAASANAKRLLALNDDTRSRIYLAAVGASEPSLELTRTGSRFDGVDGIAATNDGGIVFARRIGSRQDLVYFDPEKRTTTPLITGEGISEHPSVCRDDGMVVFARTQNGRKNIWKVPVTRAAPAVRLTNGDSDAHPACSPDGHRIVYAATDANSGKRSLRMLADGQERVLLDADVRRPVFSPDGTRIAAVYADAADHHRWRVGIIDTANGGVVPYDGVNVGSNLAPRLRWLSNEALSVVVADPKPVIRSRSIVTNESNAPVIMPGVRLVFDFDWSMRGSTFVYAGGTVDSDVVIFAEPD